MTDNRDLDFDDTVELGGESSAVGSMPISMLIEGPVATTTPDATLYEVAALLTASDIGALVVDDQLGDEEVTVAVVTERDIIRALSELADPSEVRVHHVASTNLVFCDSEATVGEVATLMSKRYLRHVLVSDDGELVGIVSARDILGVYASAED